MPWILDPWQALAKHPREHSAFASWAAALTSGGSRVTLLGSPDNEKARYEELFKLPPGELTVDAHVKIDEQPWFIDHTVLPAPRSKFLPGAMREASEVLKHNLTGAVLISPTGGLRVTVTPQIGVGRRTRHRYYQHLSAFGWQAAETGRPVYDRDAPDYDPRFPISVAEPIVPRDPTDQIMLTFANPLSWSVHATDDGWVHGTDDVRAKVFAAIVGKLTDHKDKNGRAGQLRRASTLGRQIGLLIDARVGWDTKNPVIELPTALIGDLLKELTAEYPGVLNRSWLLTSDQIAVVYETTSRRHVR
jgi:hypothetical protein